MEAMAAVADDAAVANCFWDISFAELRQAAAGTAAEAFVERSSQEGNAAYRECHLLAMSNQEFLRSRLADEGLRIDDVLNLKGVLTNVLSGLERGRFAALPAALQQLARLAFDANALTREERNGEAMKDLLQRYLRSNFPDKYKKLVLGEEAACPRSGLPREKMQRLNRERTEQDLQKKRREYANAVVCKQMSEQEGTEHAFTTIKHRINSERLQSELEGMHKADWYQKDMSILRECFLLDQFPIVREQAGNDESATLVVRFWNSLQNWCELKEIRESDQHRCQSILTDFNIILRHISPRVADVEQEVLHRSAFAMLAADADLSGILNQDGFRSGEVLEELLVAAVAKATQQTVAPEVRIAMQTAAHALLARSTHELLDSLGPVARLGVDLQLTAPIQRNEMLAVFNNFDYVPPPRTSVHAALPNDPKMNYAAIAKGIRQEVTVHRGGHLDKHIALQPQCPKTVAAQVAQGRFNKQAPFEKLPPPAKSTIVDLTNPDQAARYWRGVQAINRKAEAQIGAAALPPLAPAKKAGFVDVPKSLGPAQNALQAEPVPGQYRAITIPNPKHVAKGGDWAISLDDPSVLTVGPAMVTPGGKAIGPKVAAAADFKAAVAKPVAAVNHLDVVTKAAGPPPPPKQPHWWTHGDGHGDLRVPGQNPDLPGWPLPPKPAAPPPPKAQPMRRNSLGPDFAPEPPAPPPPKAQPKAQPDPALAPGAAESKFTVLLGTSVKVGLFALGVAFLILGGCPQDPAEWVNMITSVTRMIVDLPMLAIDTFAAISKLCGTAFQAGPKLAQFLTVCTRIGGIIGIIASCIGIYFAIKSLADSIQRGHTAHIVLDVLGIVSAGMGLAASIGFAIAAFTTGATAAAAMAWAGPLALGALGLGLLVGGIKMLIPDEPNFSSYMREEWKSEWSKDGGWPSHWDLLTTWQKIWAVTQIVVGGVELSDDRLAKELGPTPEDFIQMFLAAMAQKSESSARLETSRNVLLDVVRSLHAHHGIDSLRSGNVVVNLGLLTGGSERLRELEAYLAGEKAGLLCSNTKFKENQFLLTEVGDVLLQKLLLSIIPLYERRLLQSRPLQLLAFPSICYVARSNERGHILLQPVMIGNGFACCEDPSVLQRREKLPTGFGWDVQVATSAQHETDLEEESRPLERLLSPAMSKLGGFGFSHLVGFDLSEIVEFQSQIGNVTGVVFRGGSMQFLCQANRPPLFPTVSVHDFAVLAMLAYFHPTAFAGFSLDPASKDMPDAIEAARQAERGELHYDKRCWPHWLTGTTVSEKLFQADYALKSWVAEGLEDSGALPDAGRWTRVWLACKSSSVVREEIHDASAVGLLSIDLTVQVEARHIKYEDGRMEDVGTTEGQKDWSGRMTEAVQNVMHQHRCLKELKDLYVCRELVNTMLENQVPVNFHALEALRLPEFRAAAQAPGRVFRSFGRLAVGGCEMSGGFRNRQVRNVSDAGWSRSVATLPVLSPRAEHLAANCGAHEPTPALENYALCNPFGPRSVSPHCHHCCRPLKDPRRPHAIVQDMVGSRYCDRAECFARATDLVTPPLLNLPPPCAFCGEAFDAAVRFEDATPAVVTRTSADGPLRFLHGVCAKKWPGEEDSEQAQFVKRCVLDAPEEKVNVLEDALPGVKDSVNACLARRAQLANEDANPIHISWSLAMVALLTRDWDVLESLHAEGFHEEEQKDLAAVAERLYQATLDDLFLRACARQVKQLALPSQGAAETCCSVCQADLSSKLRMKPREDECMCVACAVTSEEVPTNCSPMIWFAPCVHDGITCDGCDLPLLGPRYKRRESAFDFDLCEVCYTVRLQDATEAFQLENFVCIDAPTCDGLQDWLAEKHASVVSACESLARHYEQMCRQHISQLTGTSRRLKSLSIGVSEANARHLAALARRRAMPDPGADDAQAWRSLDLLEAEADAWARAKATLLDEVKVCKTDAQAEVHKLRSSTASQKQRLDMDPELQEADFRKQVVEQIEHAEHLQGELNAFPLIDDPVFHRLKRFVLCPVSNADHEARLRGELSNASNGHANFCGGLSLTCVRCQQLLASEGLEMFYFSTVDDLSGFESWEVGAILIDASESSMLEELATSASRRLGLDAEHLRVVKLQSCEEGAGDVKSPPDQDQLQMLKQQHASLMAQLCEEAATGKDEEEQLRIAVELSVLQDKVETMELQRAGSCAVNSQVAGPAPNTGAFDADRLRELQDEHASLLTSCQDSMDEEEQLGLVIRLSEVQAQIQVLQQEAAAQQRTAKRLRELSDQRASLLMLSQGDLEDEEQLVGLAAELSKVEADIAALQSAADSAASLADTPAAQPSGVHGARDSSGDWTAFSGSWPAPFGVLRISEGQVVLRWSLPDSIRQRCEEALRVQTQEEASSTYDLVCRDVRCEGQFLSFGVDLPTWFSTWELRAVGREQLQLRTSTRSTALFGAPLGTWELKRTSPPECVIDRLDEVPGRLQALRSGPFQCLWAEVQQIAAKVQERQDLEIKISQAKEDSRMYDSFATRAAVAALPCNVAHADKEYRLLAEASEVAETLVRDAATHLT